MADDGGRPEFAHLVIDVADVRMDVLIPQILGGLVQENDGAGVEDHPPFVVDDLLGRVVEGV